MSRHLPAHVVMGVKAASVEEGERRVNMNPGGHPAFCDELTGRGLCFLGASSLAFSLSLSVKNWQIPPGDVTQCIQSPWQNRG